MKRLINGGKFIDGGKRDPGSGEAILCGISIHRGIWRQPLGLCIGLALFMAIPTLPAVAWAITFW